MATMVPPDLGRMAVEIDGDFSARVEPFAEAGDTHQPVGPHQGGDDTRATADRRNGDGVAHLPDGHAHIVVVAGGRHDFARETAADDWLLLRPLPLPLGQQRLDEQLAGQGGADRIAGHADNWHRRRVCPVNHTQDDRMAGPHGHAVDEQRAQRLDDVGGVILAARRGAGVEQYEVVVAGRLDDGRANRLHLIGHNGPAGGHTAPIFHL